MKDISRQDWKTNLKLVSKYSSLVCVGGECFGADKIIIAGPCRVESYEQMDKIAWFLTKNNIKFMRAGVYKPCTFPHADLGMAKKGLDILRRIKKKYDLKVVTEIMHDSQLDDIDVIDIIQIGARNTQNYNLLVEIAKTGKPILLKRHPGISLRDFLGAAEWILANGNDRVILCERGVAMPYTHHKEARWGLDITVIPAIKKYTNLPVIVDPSHSAGVRDFVVPIARAGIAAGADGLLIEIHPQPSRAKSDALQHISFKQFEGLLDDLGYNKDKE